MGPMIFARIRLAISYPENRAEKPAEKLRARKLASKADQPAAKPGGEWLYGLHAVQAALANPRRKLGRAALTPRAIETLGKKLLKRVQVETLEPGAIDRLLPPGAVHQGAALEAWPLKSRDLEETRPILQP